MPSSFTPLLEATINRVLRLDPDTLAGLNGLQGKVIRLRLASQPPREIFVLPSASGLELAENHPTAPDVTLAGDIPVFGRLMLRRVFPEVAAAGEVQISGDIELGQRFQQILKNLDIDWEEQAARFVGDVMAHQIGNGLRGLHRWSRQAWQTLGDNTVEYWQEENRLLPARLRVDAWRQAVEALHHETDRLQRRVDALREKIK